MAQRAQLEAVGRPNRIPPHNLDAEQSVLGAMLESREAIANVIEVVKAHDFYKPAHVEIYDCITALWQRGESPDAITVADELTRRGTLENVGGKPYIHGLLEAYPTAAAAGHYAQIVEELSLLRKLVDAGNKVQEIGFSLPEDVEAAVDQAEEIIYDVSERRLRDDTLPIRELLVDNMDVLEKLYERGENITGVASGFPDLDEITAGFQPDNLIIIAARPSMGKSSLLNDFALHAAAKANVPAVIFSLEMSRQELVSRFLASDARVDSQRMRRGSLQEQDWGKLSAAVGRLAEAPIFIDDSANITLMEIRAKCRRLKAKHGLGLVIIDYLQLMTSPRKSENRQQEVSEISRNLKILAKELRVPVICASQLNRGVEYRSDKRPFLGDLRESGCVTGDTRLLRADNGQEVTFMELFLSGEQNIPVMTLDEHMKVVPGTMTHVWCSGIKKVYKLTTKTGRVIRASGNHPFLTYDGWRRLDQLPIGERLAVPRRVPKPQTTKSLPDAEVILLAHMIGDGSCLRNLSTRYATQSFENAQAVMDAAAHFGVKAFCKNEPKARSMVVFMPSPHRVARGRRNPIVQWMDELGMYDKRSHEKFVPKEIFSLPNEQVALFLRHLWATDGYVGTRKTSTGMAPTVYYATNSRRLADDVSQLLLRFGIVSRIFVTHKAGYRDGYHVHIRSRESWFRFIIDVGAFGPKVPGISLVEKYLEKIGPRAAKDTIPMKVWERVRDRVAEKGMSERALEKIQGVASGGLRFNYAPNRGEMSSFASLLQDQALGDLAESDVYWDDVKTVEPDGEESVFDAEVLETHNFLANGLVLSNSIEQDSDLVMFIYRDEVYNPDSEAKGEAELIIAKHRNGPTGVVRLAFMNQYTKFASIAKVPR